MPTVYSPPVNTYIPIGSITLTSSSSSITFSSIPSSYRDLVLAGEFDPSANGVLQLAYNGSTSSIRRVRLFGGAALGAYADLADDANIGEFNTSDIRNSIIIQVMEYSATDKTKTTISRSNGLNRTMMYAQKWSNTDAVTSLTLETNQAFLSGSSFKLFGIEA